MGIGGIAGVFLAQELTDDEAVAHRRTASRAAWCGAVPGIRPQEAWTLSVSFYGFRDQRYRFQCCSTEFGINGTEFGFVVIIFATVAPGRGAIALKSE
jgi:hypothetical protein